MSDFFEVNTEMLNKSISTLREELGKLLNEFKTMLDGVMELDSVWEGPAKNAFRVQFQNDYEKFTEYCKSISELIDSLELAAKEYDTCESKVKASVDAIMI